MLTVLFLSIRSAKLKKQVERRLHTALCSGYKYLSFHTSLHLSLYHLDSCKGFCFFSFCTYVDFAAGAFVLRQSESGWKAGENIVYWLIVCSFARSFVRSTHEAILLDTIYEHCALKWNGRRSRIIVYFMTRGRAPPHPRQGRRSNSHAIYSSRYAMPKALTRARTLSLC